LVISRRKLTFLMIFKKKCSYLFFQKARCPGPGIKIIE